MRTTRSLVLAAILALSGAGTAQTLVEVTTVTAIASQLYPAMSFPPSTLRALGSGTEAVIARVPDAAAWTGWEVYTATGFAASLEPAFVYEIERGLLVDGFFRESTTTREVGAERHTRVVFSDGTQQALLYLIRNGRELVWLVARNR
jgi:hypothetical protein